MQVIVDQLLINYERQGRGKCLLLLHGWASSLNDLRPLFNDLSKDYDVISIDLPGFGASQIPDDSWDLDGYSQFLASFAKKLQLKDIYALLGHSNGGSIAIKALADNTLGAKKLILISSAGIRANFKGRRRVLKILTKTAKIAGTPLPSKTRKKLRSKLYTAIGSDLLLAEHMSETFKKVVSEDLQPLAQKLNLPTLLIYGEEDQQTPANYGRIYHQLISNSTLEIVAGAGHFIYKDKPQLVVKLIEDFLC